MNDLRLPCYVIARIVLLSVAIDVQLIHGLVSACECSRKASQTRLSHSSPVKRVLIYQLTL